MWKQFVMTHRRVEPPEDESEAVERFFEVPSGQSVHRIVGFDFGADPHLVVHVQMTTNQQPRVLDQIIGGHEGDSPTQHSVWLAYEDAPLDGQKIGQHIGTVVCMGKHLHAFMGREML